MRMSRDGPEFRDLVHEATGFMPKDLGYGRWALAIAPSGVTRVAEEDPNGPGIDPAALRSQWESCVLKIREFGVQIICPTGIQRFADSFFIGDVARRFGDALVLARMRSPARRREVDIVHEILKPMVERGSLFSIADFGSGAFLEHGDVVAFSGRRLAIVGTSGRSNEGGARALASILRNFGWRVKCVAFDSKAVTHLTGALAEINDDAVLCNSKWFHDAELLEKEGMWVIETPREEPHGAGIFSVPGKSRGIIVPEERCHTLALLDGFGFDVCSCPMEDIVALDGVPGALCTFVN